MSINRMRIDNAFRALAVLIATFALVACDGGGYDESDEPEPRAVATAIGQEFSTDSSGMMRTTTRAGAEIVLSGKDSSKGADDRGLPIIQFRWKQLPESPPASEKVNIIYRTANTISFLAPQVETETPLRFQLTVSDARGKSASTEAQVIVKPVRDENRFLQFLGADATFSAVVTTENAISPPPGGASATALLPVKITLAKLATFIDRNGILRSDIPVGESVTQNSGWAARLGTSPACDSTSNPTLRLPIPRIDLDDKLNAGIPGLGDAKLLSDVVEASDVDGITLKIRVDLEVDPAMSGAGAVPRICVNGASASAASGAIFATEALYATSMLRDSKEAASAYYEALDRYEINAGRSAKSTMDVWLESHKFDRKIQNWNSDFHAVYTNNYDLGFGRDMYMRFGDCDSGVSAQSLVQRVRDQQPLGQQFLNQFVGQCDVAAIVVNYADVEAAAKKLNPIVAVAMEYSKGPDAGRGKRFVKFYTFAPDRRDGVYRRISSVNLDRRGEQYMPQACVVCHAGTPNTKTVYYSAAQPSQSDVDVNATFLPWDLDSLLYSDTDPGFSRDSRNAVLKAQFARHAQEAQLKGLNVSAYLTYDANHRVAGRYALADELVEKWYGGPGLPNSKFGDADIPAGWAREGSSNNPMDSEAIYRNVFARNCRMCHAMHVPAGGDPRVATFSPGSPAAIPPTGPVLRLPNAPPILNPISACSADASLNGTRVGIASQVPMGCYWQFAHAPDLVDRLSRGHMPFARRTMDRMWVDQINGQTVGQIVQSHFQTTQNATVVTPGTPKAEITTSPANVDVDGVLSLDGRSSRFAQSVTWAVDACTGTPTSPVTCSRSIPVVGSNNLIGKFTVDRVATYRITQTLNAGQLTAASYFRVLDRTVSLASSNDIPEVSFQIGGTPDFPSVITELGNGLAASHSMRLTPSGGFSVSNAVCISPSSCPATTPLKITSSAVSPTSGTIGVFVTDVGGEGTLGQTSSTTVNVFAQSSFVAQPLVLSSPAIGANVTTATSLPLLAAARASVNRSDVSIVASSLVYLGPASQAPIALAFDGANLIYRPSGGFSTHDRSGIPRVGTAQLQRFSYQLRRVDTGELSSSTFTIPVNARVSFTDVKGVWGTDPNGSCGGSTCHTGTTGSAPKFGAAAFSYSSMRLGFLTRIGSKAYVDLSLADVAQNGLLCWPMNSCTGNSLTHTGSTRAATELTIVRQWIEDGANDF